MARNKSRSSLPRGSDFNLWRLGRKTLPSWVRDRILGDTQTDGVLVVKTDEGERRVGPDDVVIEQAGRFYVCSADEAADRVSRERELAAQLQASGSSESRMRTGKTKKYSPAKGMPPSIELRFPDELQIDDSYQRSIETGPSQRLIALIAANWDWRLCMPLAVSRRQDGLFVIDGQHRLAAAKLRGDIPYLPCCVASYEGPADEAAMFVAANRARRAINRLDDFHAAIVEGDEIAKDVDGVVRAAGLTVSRKIGSQSWAPGEVAFTAAIKRALKKHGASLCIEALTMIAQAFPNEILSNGGSLFSALTEILIARDQDIDLDKLLKSLGSLNARNLSALVEGVKRGEHRAQIMKVEILKLYNSAD